LTQAYRSASVAAGRGRVGVVSARPHAPFISE